MRPDKRLSSGSESNRAKLIPYGTGIALRTVTEVPQKLTIGKKR